MLARLGAKVACRVRSVFVATFNVLFKIMLVSLKGNIPVH
jgi:hypothetical protein